MGAAALLSCLKHLPAQLTVAFVGMLRQVSSQLQAAAKDNLLWGRLYMRDLAPIRGPPPEGGADEAWYKVLIIPLYTD